MTIAAILSTKGNEVATVAAGAQVRDAVALLAERRIGAVPVIGDGRICGIFSERDLVRCVSRPWPGRARLAGRPGDELAGGDGRQPDPDSRRRWRR